MRYGPDWEPYGHTESQERARRIANLAGALQRLRPGYSASHPAVQALYTHLCELISGAPLRRPGEPR